MPDDNLLPIVVGLPQLLRPYPWPGDRLCLAARISHAWLEFMHSKGWRDFCESTTEFSYIGYAYTKDAPVECIDAGELLWVTLLHHFGDEGEHRVRCSKWNMSTVTRRRELWDK